MESEKKPNHPPHRSHSPHRKRKFLALDRAINDAIHRLNSARAEYQAFMLTRLNEIYPMLIELAPEYFEPRGAFVENSRTEINFEYHPSVDEVQVDVFTLVAGQWDEKRFVISGRLFFNDKDDRAVIRSRLQEKAIEEAQRAKEIRAKREEEERETYIRLARKFKGIDLSDGEGS